jgi:hypothetical protein
MHESRSTKSEHRVIFLVLSSCTSLIPYSFSHSLYFSPRRSPRHNGAGRVAASARRGRRMSLSDMHPRQVQWPEGGRESGSRGRCHEAGRAAAGAWRGRRRGSRHASAQSKTSGRRSDSGKRAGRRPKQGNLTGSERRAATTIELGERPMLKIELEANIASALLLAVVVLQIGGGGPWWPSGWHGRSDAGTR